MIVQDRASRALKNIGSEVSALSRKQDISRAIAKNDLAMQRSANRMKVMQSTLANTRASQVSNIAAQELAILRNANKIEAGRTTIQAKRMSLSGKELGLLTQYEDKLQRLKIAERQLAETGITHTRGGLRRNGAFVSKADIALYKDLEYQVLRAQRAFTRVGLAGGANRKMLENLARASYDLAESERVLENQERKLLATRNANTRAVQTQLAALRAQRAQNAILQEQALSLQRAQMEVGPQKLAAAGRVVGHVGRTSLMAGIGTTAIAGLLAENAAEFQKQATKAATQTGNVGAGTPTILRNAGKIQKSIIDIMTKFTGSADDLNAEAYQIFSSMDVPFNKGIDLLRTFQKAAVASFTDVKTVGDSMIVTLNDFDPSLKNLNKDMNLMFATVRFGKMDFNDLPTIMEKVAPAAKDASQGLGDVSGAIAFLSTRLGTAEITGTALARMLQQFTLRPFQSGMEKLGLSVADASGKLKPLPQIIQQIAKIPGIKQGSNLANFFQFITALGTSTGKGGTANIKNIAGILQQIAGMKLSEQGKALAKLEDTITQGGKTGSQGNVRARKALTFLIRQELEYLNIQKKVNADTFEFQRAFAAASSIPAYQWEILKAQLQAFALVVGQQAIPMLIKFFGWLGNFAKRVTEASDHTKKLVAVLVVGGGAFLTFGGAALLVIGWLLRFYATLKLIRVAQMLTGASAARAAAKIGLVRAALLRIPAVIGVTILVEAVMHKDSVDNWLKSHHLGFLTRSGADLFGLGDRNRSIEEFRNPQLTKTIDDADRVAKDAARIPNKVTNKHKLSLMEQVNKKTQQILKNGKSDIGSLIDQYNNELKKLHGGDTADTVAKNADIAKQAVQQATEEVKGYVTTAINTLMSKYDELKTQNQTAFGDIFAGPYIKSDMVQARLSFAVNKLTPKDFVKDLRAQNTEFLKYRKSLDVLRARGADPKLITQLQALGPEGAKNVEALAKAPNGTLNTILRLWREGQSNIEKATKTDFQSQLKVWNSHGKNLAFQIIAGLKSENVQFENTITRMVNNAYGSAIGALRNKLTAQGISEATAKAATKAAANKKPVINVPGSVGGSFGGNGNAIRTAQSIVKKMFTLPGNNPGMLKPGNIDLLHRKVAHLANGDIATVHSASFGVDGKEVLLPEVLNGKLVSAARAYQSYLKTGKNLGTFADVKSANAYGERLHNQQAQYYGGARTQVSHNYDIKVQGSDKPADIIKAVNKAHFKFIHGLGATK